MGSGDPGETSLQSLEVEAPGPGAAYLICVFATLEGNREGVREQQIQKGNRAENIYKFKIRPACPCNIQIFASLLTNHLPSIACMKIKA